MINLYHSSPLNGHKVTVDAVVDLLKREWNLPIHLAKTQRQTLENLGISVVEVNWVLNILESYYSLDLAIGEVSLKMPLKQFIQILLKGANPTNTISPTSGYTK